MLSYKDPLGLYAFLLLIPFILLYLFSLKPEKKIFSSLMFFMKNRERSKTYAFFKRLLTNLLLFLQLLIILLLIYSSSSPQLEYSQNTTDDHYIIILDTSASMQAKMGSSTRFERSVNDAISLVNNKEMVSIILAEDIPLIALEKESGERAIEVLRNLHPSESVSNVKYAMIQANTIADKGTVYVYSDFSFSESLSAVRSQLNIKGLNVEFRQNMEAARNVGFIDYNILGDQIRIKIKNYNDRPYKIKVSSEYQSKTIELTPHEVVQETFEIRSGKTTFVLEANDDFEPDNYLFIKVPEREKIKTLYITNGYGRDFLRIALNSLDRLDITEARLPLVPDEEFDLYIIKDIDASRLLPATFEDIKRSVDSGSRVIINLQRDSLNIDYKSLQLLKLQSLNEKTDLITNINNQVTLDLDFGNKERYFSSSSYDCEKWVMSQSQNPIICYKEMGKGSVLINGILEDSSDFKQNPDYPIFWNSVLDYMFPIKQKEEVIFQTGRIIPIKYQEVQTPMRTIKTNRILMNHIGFYSYDNKTVAVNLLDFDESNINVKQDIESEMGSIIGKVSTEKGKTDLAKYLIFFGLILLILELFIIKWRGDF